MNSALSFDLTHTERRGAMPSALGWLVVAAALSAPLPAHAQASVLRAPTCNTCRIEVTRLFTLDNGADNAPLEDWPWSVAMDSRGRIAIGLRGGAGLPVVYDSAGHSPIRVGRKGKGPNEYVSPSTVAFGAGDTLHVFDLLLARHTELVGNNRLVRSNPFFGRSALLRLLPNNDVLVVSSLSSERFLLYSRTGALVRGWGQQLPPVSPGSERRPTTRISNVIGNLFWSVNSETYAFEQWALDGTRLKQIRRAADWFDVRQKFSDGALGQAPSSYVADLRVDDKNRLWVLANVASKNWRAGLGAADTKRGFTTYPNMDYGTLYDSVVEVIDIKSQKLLQSVRVPGYMRFIVSDSHLASLRESEDGSPVVDLWRYRMK